MVRPRYVGALRVSRGGQRADEVMVRWPWQRRWFSTLFFEPRLKVKITPRNEPFATGIISLETLEFDPRVGIDYWEDEKWTSTDTRRIEDVWPEGRQRRFTLHVPTVFLDGEGVYQCRLHLEELDEVDDGQFATLTESNYYVREPFRVHGTATAVTLMVGVAGLLGGLVGAIITALIG